MRNLTEHIARKINLSSPKVFSLVLAACVLTTCAVAHVVSTITFSISHPEILKAHEHAIHAQVFIITAIIASIFFMGVLNLIKHIIKLRDTLENKVRYDHLTGILSREAFLSDFDNHVIKDQDDAFLIIDADYFKRINDTYGHCIGDKALVTITNALKIGLRSTDKIGRIGGEEFAVHLKNIDKKMALEVAERLRENVKNANNEFDLAGIDLSVSIGLVIYREKMDLLSIMKKADELLYKAKEKGRNRVEHLFLQNAIVA